MGAGPVVTLANNVFTFTEQANVTGSLFNHTGTRSGTVTDDNAIDNPPEYQVLFTLDPTPSLLPWNLFVDIDVDGDSFDDPTWQGTIDVDFFVEDRQLDFLRQGQTVTQNIIVKITDVNDANVFTNQTIQVQITGANDRPTRRKTACSAWRFIPNMPTRNRRTTAKSSFVTPRWTAGSGPTVYRD